MFTDPIADMLTRIRNASQAKKAEKFYEIKLAYSPSMHAARVLPETEARDYTGLTIL
jgi:ribosomal protein S8